MPSSTGSELSSHLQVEVDRLWVACTTYALMDRANTWDRGVDKLRSEGGMDLPSLAMEDALRDVGYRLGLFRYNAQSARFHGALLGS